MNLKQFDNLKCGDLLLLRREGVARFLYEMRSSGALGVLPHPQSVFTVTDVTSTKKQQREIVEYVTLHYVSGLGAVGIADVSREFAAGFLLDSATPDP